MRASYTTLALAALLSVAACAPDSSEIVAPGHGSASSAGTGERGIGQFGSGNAIATDTTVSANSTTERGGLGLMGSGN